MNRWLSAVGLAALLLWPAHVTAVTAVPDTMSASQVNHAEVMDGSSLPDGRPKLERPRKGESKAAFAKRHGLTVKELNALNPNNSGKRDRFLPGESVNVNANFKDLNLIIYSKPRGNASGADLSAHPHDARLDSLIRYRLTQHMTLLEKEKKVPEEVMVKLKSMIEWGEYRFVTMKSTDEQPLRHTWLTFGGERKGSKPDLWWGDIFCRWTRTVRGKTERVYLRPAIVFPAVVINGQAWQQGMYLDCQNGFGNVFEAAPAPVLRLTKDAPATVRPGELMTYTLRWAVENDGVTEAVIVDDLPSGVTYVSDGSKGSCTAQTVTWNLGTLTPGSSGTVSIQVRVGQLTDGTTLVNTAEFDAKETEPMQASATTRIVVPKPVAPPPPPAPRPVAPAIVREPIKHRDYQADYTAWLTYERVQVDPNGRPASERTQNNFFIGHEMTGWSSGAKRLGLRLRNAEALFDMKARSGDHNLGAVVVPFSNRRLRLDVEGGIGYTAMQRLYVEVDHPDDNTWTWEEKKRTTEGFGPYLRTQWLFPWDIYADLKWRDHDVIENIGGYMTVRPGRFYAKAAYDLQVRDIAKRHVDGLTIVFPADTMTMVEGRLGVSLTPRLLVYGSYQEWEYGSTNYWFTRKGFGAGTEWYPFQSPAWRIDAKVIRFDNHDHARYQTDAGMVDINSNDKEWRGNVGIVYSRQPK